ncbi:MAG: hypothetical protein EBS96_10325 [Spartobacteria bacterium]|nr:hypothetical protein [Spartobacteria bacterium]
MKSLWREIIDLKSTSAYFFLIRSDQAAKSVQTIPQKIIEKVINDYYETILHRQPSHKEIRDCLEICSSSNLAEIALDFIFSRERQTLSNRIESQKIAFLHIPKTAGSSINSFFNRFTNKIFSTHSENQIKLEEASLVTGHFYFSLLKRIAFTHSFTILRNPVARIVSLYRYGLSSLSGWNPDDPVRHLSFEEWLESRDPAVVNIIDSYYVRVLTDDLQEPFENHREKSLQLALERYKNFTSVGDQGNLEPFFKNMSAALGIPCPLKMPAANVAEVNQQFDANYIPKPEITPRAKRRLEELTRLDWEVYNTFREREKIKLSGTFRIDLNQQNENGSQVNAQIACQWLDADWNILEVASPIVTPMLEKSSDPAKTIFEIELKAPEIPGTYHLALSPAGVGTDSSLSDWKITPSIFDIEVTSDSQRG